MEKNWYAVRCVLAFDGLYEERITLWSATDPDEAIAKAQAEADEHAEMLDGSFTGFSQSYWLDDAPGEEGSEIFSLMRDSTLAPQDYIERFL